MARKPRFHIVGIPQHIIQRGNNRAPCFFCDDDYQCYLNILNEALVRNRCRLHAYVLMTNHVHLLVTPMQEHGVSFLMQDIGRKYVRYVNKVHKRTGTLWEGRYRSSLVDSEAYLLTCMRYIELNPVRASIAKQPDAYRWSSYAANAAGVPNTLLTRHPVYENLGHDSSSRLHSYRNLFLTHPLDNQLHEIREMLNQELVLGRDEFKDRIAQITTRQSRPGQNGRPRKGGVEESVGDYYVC